MEKNLVGRHYESVKTGDIVLVTAVAGETATIQFADGSTKDVSESTLKRWYKPAKAEDIVNAAAAIVGETPEETAAENVEEGPVDPEPIEDAASAGEPVPEPAANPAANDGVPPITEPKPDKKPKVAEGLKIAQDCITQDAEKLGIKVEFDDRFVLQDGKKIMAIFPGGIAVRPAVATALGLAAEVKKYNHPFQARLTLEKDLVTKVLKQINKPVEAATDAK